MSKREDWDDTGVVHVRDLDVSERRRVTPAEREVLRLLDMDDGQPWQRLSLAMWARVDAVAARLDRNQDRKLGETA